MHSPFAAPRPPLPESPLDWALFLDVDGTLAEFAPRPDEVVISPAIIAALEALNRLLGGAMAIVSGRPIAQIDALFAPLVLAAGGLHGLQRRLPGETAATLPESPAWHGAVAAALDVFVDAHPGAWVEDKGTTLALHYRGAPQIDEAAHALADEVAAAGHDGLAVQTGKMIVEFRPPGADKGDVIDFFLGHPPFAGRLPVFLGDDLTDEDGFRAVKAHGGLAVHVGGVRDASETSADWHLGSVGDAERWIVELAAALGGPGTLAGDRNR